MKRNNKPHDGKHEAYYTLKDYQYLYEVSEKGRYLNDSDPYTRLLCAKAYFVERKYQKTIDILEGIEIGHSTKILYERQALRIQAGYLSGEGKPKLRAIFDDYEYHRTRCPGRGLTNFHHSSIKKLIQMVELDKKPSVSKQQIKKQCKALGSSRKYEGMISYILEKDWNKKWSEYILYEGEYPGPITNFRLLNHIFEFEPQLSQRHAYMDTLLFPLSEEVHYVMLGRKHWEYIKDIYGGYSIQRYYIINQREEDVFGGDNLARILLEFKEEKYLMQWQKGTYWENSVFPQLQNLFGSGQIKQQTSNMNQFLIVPYGEVHQPSTLLRYIPIKSNIIMAETPEEIARRNKLFYRFDMEKYVFFSSTSNGLVGLVNLGNTCYMNSAIQCLSNIEEIREHFVTNQYLEFLNITDNNKIGSFGAVTCALADILKRLWFCSEKTKYIDPRAFKTTFETRFQQFRGNEQEDSSQFLGFLLNCLHDDLNRVHVPALHNRDSVIERQFESARNHAISAYNDQNKSIISQLFCGHLFEEIHCRQCEKTRFRFQTFLSLPIQIPEQCLNIRLFLVPGEKYNEPALAITIYLNDIQTVSQMIEEVKKKRNDKMKYHAFYVEQDNYTFKEQLDCDQKVKHVIEKRKNKKYHLFMYQLPQIQEDEFYCAFNYSYHGGPDGFPRIVPLRKSEIKEKTETKEQQEEKQKLLKKKVLETMDVPQYRKDIDDINGVEYLEQKGKLYTKLIKADMARNNRMFNQTQLNEKFGNDGKQTDERKLEACLNKLQEKQEISHDIGWWCEGCQAVTQAYKTCRLYSISDVLMIVLKRFSNNDKIQTKIQYPVELDLTPYLHEPDPRLSHIYSLNGVILHHGSVNFGHYISYCLNSCNKKWYLYDDDDVRQIDPKYIIHENAYILFYHRKS